MNTIVFGIGVFILIGALLYDVIVLKMKYKWLSNILQLLAYAFFILDSYLSENIELLIFFVVAFLYTFGLKVYKKYFNIIK